jgi:hypothetical protein
MVALKKERGLVIKRRLIFKQNPIKLASRYPWPLIPQTIRKLTIWHNAVVDIFFEAKPVFI